jgi:hypothetical protein
MTDESHLAEGQLDEISGSVTALGSDLDAILVAARQKIEQMANGRPARITTLSAAPKYESLGGNRVIWEAQIDFKVKTRDGDI